MMQQENEKRVILVDESDKEIGTASKLAAHIDAKMHRAFSIFIFDKEGRLLIQQRAKSKYHCPGLWSNTCCSHPQPGQTLLEAAHKRLQEEMGFDAILTEDDAFIYRAEFDNSLTEYEYDHILIGTWDGVPKPNPDEVAAYQWISREELGRRLAQDKEQFTVWFQIAIERINSEA